MACCIILRSILVSLLGIHIITFWGLSALLALQSEFVLLSCWKNFSGAAQLSAQYSHKVVLGLVFFWWEWWQSFIKLLLLFPRVIRHWKRLLCWGGAEQHIALHSQGNTQTERGRWKLAVTYNLYKAGKYPTPCLMQTQYENNGAIFFILVFEASTSTLTLFLTPACCRNAGRKGNGEMPTLAWLCNYCRLSCTLCWWRAFCLQMISWRRTVYDHCS